MGARLSARRRLLAAKGRPAVLRRVGKGIATAQVTVQTFVTAFQPGEVIGAVQQGDEHAVITNDEIAAAGWPGPPRYGDQIVVDGSTRSLQGVAADYSGTELVGFSLWVRG